MDAETAARIMADPRYQALIARRGRFAWVLTLLLLAAYFGYIGLIAFDKTVLARPVGSGVTTWGIPVGIGLILFTIGLTAVYVARANGEFDRLTREIVAELEA